MDKSIRTQDVENVFNNYKTFLARNDIKLSSYSENNFLKNYQEVHRLICGDKFINKDMKDSIVKLKLIYGEPQIAYLEIEDDELVIEILVPGLPIETSEIHIEIYDEKVNINLPVPFRHTKAFTVELSSDKLMFEELLASRDSGVLTIKIPLIVEYKLLDKPIKFSL